MISMYAEYSGRTLYVALSTDTIDGAKNGDKLYHMDTGKRYVYNETNDAWDEQPEEGGGGGGNQILTWALQVVNGTTKGTTTQRNIIVIGVYDQDKHCLTRKSVTVSASHSLVAIPQSLRTTPATRISRTLVMVGVNKNLTSPTYTLEGDVGFYAETDSVPELGTGYTGYLFAVYGDNAKITISN